MKRKIINGCKIVCLSCLSFLMFQSCSDKEEQYDELIAYMRNDKIPFDEGSATVVYNGISYKGDTLIRIPVRLTRPVNRDVIVNISAADSLIDKYNQANHTDFQMLPAQCFTIEHTVIKKGTDIDSVKVNIIRENIPFDGVDYMIPLQMVCSSDGMSSTNFNSYFIVMRTGLSNIEGKLLPSPPIFVSHEGWSIKAVDSEEVSGEGPNNGRAKYAIDGNIGTFWHSQWQGALPKLPHWLDIDMGKVNKIKGLAYVNRQDVNNGGFPTKIEISTSVDGNEWSEPWTYVVNTGSEKKFVLFPKTVDVRYFRFKIVNNDGNQPYTYLAEVDALSAE